MLRTFSEVSLEIVLFFSSTGISVSSPVSESIADFTTRGVTSLPPFTILDTAVTN